MVKLSLKTLQLLKEDIISILYDKPLLTRFTNEIALELRRDNEFTKKLLLELKKEGFIEEIKKNKKGQNYIARSKWRIPSRILKAYKQS